MFQKFFGELTLDSSESWFNDWSNPDILNLDATPAFYEFPILLCYGDWPPLLGDCPPVADDCIAFWLTAVDLLCGDRGEFDCSERLIKLGFEILFILPVCKLSYTSFIF